MSPAPAGLARVALVTGGGRGIGRAVALALAAAGHEVAVVARSSAELEAVAAEVTALGRRALPVSADLADAAAVSSMAARVRAELGAVDVLVNNAGVELSVPFGETTPEAWNRVQAVNLGATFLCTQALVPSMLERRWGRVINIASTAGRTGYRFSAAYCAAKHGVVGLTRALALELGRSGVTVNAVCPGWVETSMLDRAAANIAGKTGRSVDEARQTLAAMNPQRRLVRPEEVAAMVTYLASDAAAPVTGQVLGIDGGEVLA
jgi:3-hydroxybutyrate dehydrogenase